MPVPSGNFSRRRIGGGLRMSNTRKSIKPASSACHTMGHAISVTSCPATSSMTTCEGSFLPQPRASRVAAGIPMATDEDDQHQDNGNSRRRRKMRSQQPPEQSGRQRSPGARAGTQAAPRRRRWPPASPTIGADERFARRLSLAFCHAHSRIAGIVGLRIVQRRRDDVAAAGPLAQIDHAAALAAEGKVGIGGQHDLAAGGTTEAEVLFLWHTDRGKFRAR